MARTRTRPDTSATPDRASPRPAWARTLRALREARGVTQDGWATLLGVGRTSVQRWERGEAVPDAFAEDALVDLCRERGLLRPYDQGPLVGITVTEAWLRDLLASARLGESGSPVAPGSTLDSSSSTTPPSTHATTALPPGNLPEPVSSFVGRAAERAEVRRLLGTTRLLTLTGTGGVGKTRLALAVAAEVRWAYPDGVWFVDLAPLTDPALVPQALLAALGMREQPDRTALDTLLAHLRERHLLVVVDNCEHIVEACAALVEAVLQTAAAVRVLATSREALGLTGEVRFRVPSLAVPPDDGAESRGPRPAEEAGRLSGYDAVLLFVERARAVAPAFAVTDATARFVIEICRRLDGIALALELAAARVTVMSVEEIAARLDDRFRLLTGGSRTAFPRQQTLRAAIDWSHDLLSEPEQVLFRRLAVFAGGWTLAAAEAVCAGEGIEPGEVLDLLSGLVNRSLVIVEEAGGTTRYALLESLRQYGRERLEADDLAAAVADRHLAWCVTLAQEAAEALRGPGQVAWLTRLGDEHDNLRAALAGAVRSGATEAGLRIMVGTFPYWHTRGYLAEGRRWLEALEPGMREETIPLVLRGQSLSVMGAFADALNDYATAHSHYTEALAAYRAAAFHAGVAAVLNNMAASANRQRDFVAARRFLEEGLIVARASDDRHTMLSILVNLAAVSSTMGDISGSRKYYDECLMLAREQGNISLLAHALGNLGAMLVQQNEMDLSLPYVQESLELRRRIGDKRGVAIMLNILGIIARAKGDHGNGLSFLEESVALFRELEDKQLLAGVMGNMGYNLLPTGDYSAAYRYFRESLIGYRELGDRLGIAQVLESLATMYTALALPERAVRLVAAADRLRRELAIPPFPKDRSEQDEVLATLNDTLGGEAVARLWAEGEALTWEAAVALALEDAPAPHPATDGER